MTGRPASTLTAGIPIFITALVLGGCASTPPASTRSAPDPNYNPNAGRYSMDRDSPLLEPIDLTKVAPVVPKPEVRTIAGNKSPYTINGRTYYVRDTEEGYVANGYASWYGRKFHGHQTSNGETYDMFGLSAAHKTLPIPSYARVTNLDNGKSVVVRINDRGPFHDDRIIDLSYAAAVTLDYAAKGTARVKVEAVLPQMTPAPALLADSTPVPAAQATTVARPATTLMPSGITSAPLPDTAVAPMTTTAMQEAPGEYLQVGAFASEESARNLIPRLSAITSLPVIIHSEAQPGSATLLHRVRLGPLAEGLDIKPLIDAIRAANLGNPYRVRQ